MQVTPLKPYGAKHQHREALVLLVLSAPCSERTVLTVPRVEEGGLMDVQPRDWVLETVYFMGVAHGTPNDERAIFGMLYSSLRSRLAMSKLPISRGS